MSPTILLPTGVPDLQLRYQTAELSRGDAESPVTGDTTFRLFVAESLPTVVQGIRVHGLGQLLEAHAGQAPRYLDHGQDEMKDGADVQQLIPGFVSDQLLAKAWVARGGIAFSERCIFQAAL